MEANDESDDGGGGDGRVMRGSGRPPIYETVESNQATAAALPDYYGDRQAACLRTWVRVLSSVSLALLLSVVVLGVYTNSLLTDEEENAEDYIAPPGSGSDNCGGDNSECSKSPSWLGSSPQWRTLPPSDTVLTTIAFGSCSSQRMPQPYWDTVVVDSKPDLLLLMGDNVYGDCLPDEPNVTAACEPLRQAYREFGRHPSVMGAAPLVSVYATLDDHDYGVGDADMHNPYKEYARQLFADFFQIPVQQLPEDGVYRSQTWGADVGRRLQVILLDTRFGRSPFVRTGNQSAPYRPYDNTHTDDDYNYQMLSETQWQWLTARLNEPADLRIIVSSVQVLNDVTGFECWRHLPKELDRLKSLIRNKCVILLSGDRHVGGFYYEDGSSLFREITASSWTHTLPFGAYSDCSSAEECDEKDPRRDGDMVRVNHFGTIDIDWEHQNVSVALRRAESSYASSYFYPGCSHCKGGDADNVIVERSWSFPF